MVDDGQDAFEGVEDTAAAEAEDYDPAAEIAALKDQLLRYAAEADNVRRRAEKEANDARAYAIQRFARDLLDAADNLARATAHAPKGSGDAAVNNFVTGVEMTEKALQAAFERNGLKMVNPAQGESFDPNLHQAVMEQPAEGVPPGSVVNVMQTGYTLFGRLVRPAMVSVTPKGSAPAAATPGAEVDTKA